MILKEKLELIKKIESYHPAAEAGHKRGWNTYVGGMADTGSWFTWKMIEAPEQELIDCLNELIEEFKPSPPLSPEDQIKLNTPVFYGVGITNQLEVERLTKWMIERDSAIMWGPKKTRYGDL